MKFGWNRCGKNVHGSKLLFRYYTLTTEQSSWPIHKQYNTTHINNTTTNINVYHKWMAKSYIYK